MTDELAARRRRKLEAQGRAYVLCDHQGCGATVELTPEGLPDAWQVSSTLIGPGNRVFSILCPLHRLPI